MPDSIYNGGFSRDELLKILEFTASIKVAKYKGIVFEWNVADEQVLSEGSSDKWGFWQRSLGLLDGPRLAASVVRRVDPAARTSVADDHELEERFYDLQPLLFERLIVFATDLKKGGLLDAVDVENNLWIYDLPGQGHMTGALRKIQAEGFEIAAAEISVLPTVDFPFWYLPRQQYSVVVDPLRSQAEGYRRAVQAYIDAGVYDIGLGDVGDETSSANYFFPGSNPAPYDDQWRPKMCYYEVLKAMFGAFL